jgi:hypothetical protein
MVYHVLPMLVCGVGIDLTPYQRNGLRRAESRLNVAKGSFNTFMRL